MTRPVDIARLRKRSTEVQAELKGLIHPPECEYYHATCAVLALCNEVDRLREVLQRIASMSPYGTETMEAIVLARAALGEGER